jgi:hypothetical protein
VKINRAILLLILFSLFLVGGNLLWLSLDQRPASWDAAVHLNLTWNYFQIIKHFSADTLKQIIAVSGYYPPLFHLTAVPLFGMMGASLHAGLLVNIIYLLVLVWATFGIGKILYNELTGLLAAMIVGMYPFLIFMSRTYVVDLALASSVTLGFYLYLKSENFTKPWPSLLFGLVTGLGMLVKWTYAFFLLGPVVYGFWKGSKKKFLASGIVAVLVAGPWYGYNLIKFIRYSIRYSGIGASEGDPRIMTLGSIFYYTRNLLMQIQPVFLVLFIIGLVIFLMTYKKQNKVLLWWMILPYLILTLIRNKDERYTLPLLAAVSIISCFWIANLKNNFWRHAAVTGAVVFSISQFFFTSFADSKHYYCQPPRSGNWQQAEVAGLISRSREKGQDYTSVSVVMNHSYWHSETLDFYAVSHQLPLLFKGYEQNLGQFADYVITKTGDLGPAFSLGGMPEARTAILDKSGNFSRHFDLIGVFGLPDNSYLLVYKRKAQPDMSLIAGFSYLNMEAKLAKSLDEYLKDSQDLRIKLVGDDNDKAHRGQFKEMVITAKRARINGLWLDNLKLELKGLEMDLPLFWQKNELIIYSLKEIRPEFTIKTASLQELLEAKAKNIKSPLVSIQHGVVNVEGKLKNISLRVKFTATASDRELQARFLKVKAGMITIPHWLYAGILEKPLALTPTLEWPAATTISRITMEDDKLTVGGL